MKTCWIISDGCAGMVNQCLGVAEALGLSPVEKTVRLRAPWRWGTPFLRWGSAYALAKESSDLTKPFPDVIIGCGRQAVVPMLHIKKLSAGKTTAIQVQNPVISTKHFDVVVAPLHDNVKGENVIHTLGAPHRVSLKRLESERHKFPEFKKEKEEKLIGVLIGGACKAYPMDSDSAMGLINSLESLAKQGHRLLISPSRRTPPFLMELLNKAVIAGKLGASPFLWDMQGENPYFPILANADALLVTCDSVCMITEACVTDKPVYLFPLKGGNVKFKSFHNGLLSKGRVQWFPMDGHLQWTTTTPFNEMEFVAQELQKYI
jgi:mitochondrial fission protein ELM1